MAGHEIKSPGHFVTKRKVEQKVENKLKKPKTHKRERGRKVDYSRANVTVDMKQK